MKKGILIALLIVCILILGALILNLANGGVWIVRGLDGADGIDGSDGVDGSDGKDGKDGEDGQNGKDGEDGKDGANGKSAYELAVEDGFQGSLHEWLLLLAVRGADGKDGRPGADGAGIADVRINGQGDLIVILTNGKTVNAGHVGGEGVLEEEPDAQGFYPVYETVIQKRGTVFESSSHSGYGFRRDSDLNRQGNRAVAHRGPANRERVQ